MCLHKTGRRNETRLTATGSLERLSPTNDVVSGGNGVGVTELALADVGDMTAAVATPSAVGGPKEMKFEQTRVASATSTKITTGDGYSSEEATANASHSRRVQADGVHYEESGQAAAMKARLEMDGITAEKAAAVKQVRPSFPLLFHDSSIRLYHPRIFGRNRHFYTIKPSGYIIRFYRPL